jgi:hypothetical protein
LILTTEKQTKKMMSSSTRFTLLFAAVVLTNINRIFCQSVNQETEIPLQVDGSKRFQKIGGIGVDADTSGWSDKELESGLSLLIQNFYAIQQVSKFVSPSSRRISVSEPSATLAVLVLYDTTSQSVSIVGLNKKNSPIALNGSLENLPIISRLEMYHTDDSVNLQKGSTIQMIGKAFKTMIPANCIFVLTGAGIPKRMKPEPTDWYAGDMHVHLDCNGPEQYAEDELARMMEPNDLAVISVLADVGTGTLKDAKRDLPKVGTDSQQSRPGRLIHWDTEWLWWDAENVKTLSLGGHLALLGLKDAHPIGETPHEVLEWGRKQNAVGGFVHMQYLNDSIQNKLNCCIPIDYPVEAALGSLDFVSEDVYGNKSYNGGGTYDSEAAIHAYYKLLNCGFRLGLAAGTDYPCNEFEPLGSLLTYVNVQGELTYRKWIDGIKNGKTVVSRNGHNEFIELTVGGKYGPGADIKIKGSGTVSTEITWTAAKELRGRIELVINGKVVATQAGIAKPGEPLVLKATQKFDQSGWICARRMDENEHLTHTAPVFVTVNKKPVRVSGEDATYFIAWIDNILNNIAPGGIWEAYFTYDLDKVRKRYQKARVIYSKILSESNGDKKLE